MNRIGLGVVALLCVGVPCLLALRVYTNSWAVQVAGGPQEVEKITKKFGFISLGQVTTLCPSFFISVHCVLEQVTLLA